MSNSKSKKPTNKDVARLAGVSVATVSYVINGRTDKKILEETKKKVFHAINFLGYVPNPHAVAMKTNTNDIEVRTSKSNTVLQNMEVFEILKKFTAVCKEKGYAVHFSAEDEPSKIAALACVCIGLKREEFHALASENFIPVISVDGLLNDPVFFQITTDYAEIKKRAEAEFKGNYTYVCISINDNRLKDEILSIIPNTVFIKELGDIENSNFGNTVVSDYVLSKILPGKISLDLSDRKTQKLKAVIECIEKALKREKVADEKHYIRI